jgi:hypothetical protein
MHFENLPEEIIARIAGFLPFDQVKVMRDSGICLDLMEIVDRNWKMFRHYGNTGAASDKSKNMSKYTPKRTRLYIFQNGSTKRLVIRSRGAANLMSLWNVSTGTFELGQWLCKKPLDLKGCAYLPCGRFIYRFHQHRCDETTVVCTPPYFTAHALWEQYTGCFSPSTHVLTSPAAPENFLEIRRILQSAPRPIEVEGQELLDDRGNVVHDFSNDVFRPLAPPASYIRGTATPASSRSLEHECQMMELMREVRLRGREKDREEKRSRNQKERWACSRCSKTYTLNQRARITAHTAKHTDPLSS